MSNKIISPSVLAADFCNLGRDINMLNDSNAEWIHLDIMDGVFVPNISYGMPIVEQIAKISDKVMDVHLMIVQPERYIETFKNIGANVLTVHYETCTHLHRTLQEIHSCGMKAGVALNPHTPVSLLEDVIEDIDLVLIMSVNPGFGGQKFIERTYTKIKQTRKLIDSRNAKTVIEVDGGVNKDNSAKLYAAGANVLVAGSAVFNSDNPKDYIDLLLK